jgi:YfiH family protein
MKQTTEGSQTPVFDLIIIGAGAAGLFAGASLSSPVSGLVLEKSAAPGKKLLMSGGGQCNLTHGGSIKEFVSHYGQNGKRIRPILYRFNNLAVMEFFRGKGVPLIEREDGKVFPKSLQARDVLDVLVKECVKNGLEFNYSTPVTSIRFDSTSSIHTVFCGQTAYRTRRIIVATGGCSYPTTGSDGSFFSVIKEMGIKIMPPKPALVPIYAQQYPYKELAGISFDAAKVTISNDGKTIGEQTDGLLFTHDCFSGPAILNCSRYAAPGHDLMINYIPGKSADVMYKELQQILPGNGKQLLTVLYEFINGNISESDALDWDASDVPRGIPKRFLETICVHAGGIPTQKVTQVSGTTWKTIFRLLTGDRHSISGVGGYNIAMVTTGGVSLDEVNLKTLESKKLPGLFFAGEVLDVDGDTGGYNLQFAFSSGYLAKESIAGIEHGDGSLFYFKTENRSHVLPDSHFLSGMSLKVHAAPEQNNMALHASVSTEAVLENRRTMAASLQCGLDDLVCAEQTHSANFHRVTLADKGRGARSMKTAIPNTDALYSYESNLVLCCFTADCVPVFFHNEKTGLIGLIHSGWKGTVQEITRRVFDHLIQHENCNSHDLHIQIGPALSQARFEVDSDVQMQFKSLGYGDDLISFNEDTGKYHVDNQGFVALQCEIAGIPSNQIAIDRTCTFDDPRYFSYRQDPNCGRHLCFIMRKGE